LVKNWYLHLDYNMNLKPKCVIPILQYSLMLTTIASLQTRLLCGGLQSHIVVAQDIHTEQDVPLVKNWYLHLDYNMNLKPKYVIPILQYSLMLTTIASLQTRSLCDGLQSHIIVAQDIHTE
jgi:hypothetical protein